MNLKVWPFVVGSIGCSIVGVVTGNVIAGTIAVFMMCLAVSIDLGRKP